MITGTTTLAVEFHHVTKNYGSVQALKGMSLTIKPGEVVAILGPNGAGKSTALALMLGMRRPTSGSVTLFGENPRVADHRKHIGVMLQESGVPGTLKVHELVELFGRFHDNPMVTQEAVKMAGLEEKANTRLSRLSGGQKQRVYFALALVGNPDVLFLDEPTTGLDVEARRNFWDQINNQVAQGKTIILTTHNLEEADALAKRIVVINQGQIIADGTPDEIKDHVGGKHVRFRAPHITIEALRLLAGAQSFQLMGTTFEIYTMQPEAMLATLFKSGAELSDLEVVGAGLEEAFLALTDNDKHEELGSKFLVIILTGVISLLLLFAVAAISGERQMDLVVWVQLLGLMVVGMIPLGLMGLFLGLVGSTNLTTALSTVLMLLLSFATGLWIPLRYMPDFLRTIAPYLPTYHLGQLAWITVGSSYNRDDQPLWVHLLILLAYAAVFAALAGWAYIRDENKNFA